MTQNIKSFFLEILKFITYMCNCDVVSESVCVGTQMVYVSV